MRNGRLATVLRPARTQSPATSFGVELFVSKKKSAFGRSSFLRRSAARQSTKNALLYFRLGLSSMFVCAQIWDLISPLPTLYLPACQVSVNENVELGGNERRTDAYHKQQSVFPSCEFLACVAQFRFVEKHMQTNVVHPPKDRIITQVWSQQRVQTGWCLQQVGRVNHACGTQTFDERILNNSFKCAGVAFNSESASALFGQRLQSINDVPPAHPAIVRAGTHGNTGIFVVV